MCDLGGRRKCPLKNSGFGCIVRCLCYGTCCIVAVFPSAVG